MSIRTGGPGRLLAGGAPSGSSPAAAVEPRPPRPSYAAIAVGSLAVAGLSLLLLPRGIAYDPWSWLIWGRELLHGQLTTTNAATSIKPLPVGLDTLFAVFGSKAAPVLWLLTARAAAIAALGLGFRLGDRLAGPVAGLLAAIGVGAISQYAGYLFFSGMSEPMATGTALLAADAAIARKHRLAFFALLLTGWLRIEVWPIALGYAAWRLWVDARERGSGPGSRRRLVERAVVAGFALLMLPVAWFGLDWIGSGTPLRSTSAASHQSQGGPLLTAHPGLATVTETVHLLPASLAVAGVVTWLWALLRVREPRWQPVRWLGAAAVVWLAVAAAMAGARVATGAPRYLMPAAGVAGVIGAAGIVWACRAVLSRGAARPLLVASVALVIGVGGGIVQLIRAVDSGLTEVAPDQQLQSLADELPTAVRLAGGGAALNRCAKVAVEGFQVPALAWVAGLHLDEVGPHPMPRGTVVQVQGRPALPAGASYRRLGAIGSGPDRIVVVSGCSPAAAAGRPASP